MKPFISLKIKLKYIIPIILNYFNSTVVSARLPPHVFIRCELCFVFFNALFIKYYTSQNESKTSAIQIDLFDWEFTPVETPVEDITVPAKVYMAPY